MVTLEALRQIYDTLREDMKKRWNRYVPVGELLQDRWSRSQSMGFGEGSNIYDSAIVIGNVKVGKKCWIGPNTYLDGMGSLAIGNHVTIGVGSTIFTHTSAERDLSGGEYPAITGDTTIGDHVFIAPHCVIEMNANIGDHSVIMSHSVVKWPVPAYSIVHGSPARLIGKVIIEKGTRPSLRYNREGMEIMKSAHDTFSTRP